MHELHKIYQFFKDIEPLKDTLRTGMTRQGRQESVAEHSWRLATMAVVLCPTYFPALDLKKVMEMCLIHDLGEVINGDIPAPLQVNTPDKSEHERRDFIEVCKALPEDFATGLLEVWDEYEGASTPEAKFVKAIDKIESILQHNQGNFAPDFDHAFDLSYGQQYMTVDPIIEELRKMVDKDTQQIIDESD